MDDGDGKATIDAQDALKPLPHNIDRKLQVGIGCGDRGKCGECIRVRWKVELDVWCFLVEFEQDYARFH